MAASAAISTASFLHPTLASKFHASPPTNRLFSVPSPITWNPRVRVSPSRSSFEVEAEKPRAAIEMDAAMESELRETGFMGMRKTKLVCTVGPACSSEDALELLARSGMSVARLNMCHGSREWHRRVIRAVKRMNREKGFCVSLMIDTEGSQMHMVNHAAESTVKAEDGTMWLFTTANFESPRPNTIQVNWEGFSEDIVVGDELLFDGGMATFEVVEKIGNDLNCKCIDPGLLLPRAKLSFWRDGVLVGKKSGLPTLSSKDWADIEFGISEGIDFIAVSFVKDAHDIKHLKSYLSDRSESIRVIAKIESLESIENLLDIVSASDGIMVARRDLGVHVSLEQIPTVQEVVTRLCRQLNKPVIVASQLLESMIEYPTPTRAEVADVSEAVRQCADALMLSGESAVGSYADKALLVLRMTSTRMEMWRREENSQNMQSLPQLEFSLTERISEQISNSAVEMANNLGVDAIFVYTKHGHMASLLSRNRPNPPIFAFTDSARTRNWMNLHWGVMPFELPLSDEMEANFMETICFMRNHGTLKSGDVVLVVSDVDSAIYSSSQCIQVRTIF